MKSGTAVAVFVLVAMVTAGVTAGYMVLSTNHTTSTISTTHSGAASTVCNTTPSSGGSSVEHQVTPCATSSSTTSAACVITGQPGAMNVRVLSDSPQTPVGGAEVSATNQPALCNGTPASTQKNHVFNTSGSVEWNTLDGENNAGYSFIVTYSDRSYNFSASLNPLSVTCATLYVPSGKTNVTILEFQTSCPTIYVSASGEAVHSSISGLGLQLTATVASPRLEVGQNLTVVAEVNNTLSRKLTVNTTSMTNPAFGPCQQEFARPGADGLDLLAQNI